LIAVNSVFSQAVTFSCGTYGPRYFFNAGASLQTTAVFSAPLSALSSGPYLLGCTPSQAILEVKNGSEYVIYSYVANKFIVSTAHWYRNGASLGNLGNTYQSYTTKYPLVISSSQFTSGPNFINFTMEYDDSTDYLETVSIYAPNVDELQKMQDYNPIDPRLKGFTVYESDPNEHFEGLISYQYTDKNVPLQATNISFSNNLQGESTIFNQYTTNSQKYVSKIQTTITASNQKSSSTSFLYYDSNGKMTKICAVSCAYYTYDSDGRLTSVAENGVTLETYKYNTVNGVSQVVSANLGPMGKWTFKY